MSNNTDYLKKTRLVEEVPGIDPDEKYFIWHNYQTVWKGPSKAAGEAWAAQNGITIEQFEAWEP